MTPGKSLNGRDAREAGQELSIKGHGGKGHVGRKGKSTTEGRGRCERVNEINEDPGA